jgi:hypothetical protein
MDEARTRPELEKVIGIAWSRLVMALSRMPGLFAILTVVNVATGWGELWVENAVLTGALATRIPFGLQVLVSIVLVCLSALVSSVALSCVAVGVHRFILLDEVSSLRSLVHKRVGVFALWAFALQFAIGFVYSLSSLTGLFWMQMLTLAVIAFFTVRLALIFPAIAVDAAAAGPRQRLKTTWVETRGLFWVIFLAMLVCIVPLAVFSWLPGGILLLVVSANSFTDSLIRIADWIGGVEGIATIFRGLVEPFQVALAAGVASAVFLWRQDNPCTTPLADQAAPQI